MTGKNTRLNTFLRLISGDSTVERYSLIDGKEVIIGRDPNCQIILDAFTYRMVSRRHAVLRPLPTLTEGENRWVVCDLNSANGTYLNGQLLKECQELQLGDVITLGQDGPEFRFEYEAVPQQTVISNSNGSLPHASGQLHSGNTGAKPLTGMGRSPDSGVSFTQLFPIISTGKDLTTKAYLMPGVITVLFVVLMFATVGRPQTNQLIIALYIALAAYFFIYRLCGKHKPWWVLFASTATTALILESPILNIFIFVFRKILPGDIPEPGQSIPFLQLLIAMFFGAGLMEELLKALPVLGAYLIAQGLPSPKRERIGVWEPLDGILLGTASAIGFTLIETLTQYVPEISRQVAEGQGNLVGLQLLIPRILGSVSGHMAYSGYFGYFIGLAVLKPTKGWQILGVGYLTSASLHALWNSIGNINTFLLVVVGVLSYAFLMAAILKARALSPTRSQNFATRFVEPK
jgi:RsiW-degrading membrane proteinase PrsW (M82 family)